MKQLSVPPTRATTPGAVLREAGPARFDLDPGLRGFGGVHGGLALALLTREMSAALPDRPLRSVSGQFLAAIRDAATTRTTVLRAGREVAAARSEAHDGRGPRLVATSLFGRAGSVPGDAPAESPPSPWAPPPEELESFNVPPEFVPFTSHLDIRPVGDARPYIGGDDPELLAWIRFVEDDDPPDVLRLVTLADALAPSYAAVLVEPLLLPTIQLEVRPTADAGTAPSPWVLVRARSTSITADGWVDERIDLWSPDRRHLAAANQSRLLIRS